MTEETDIALRDGRRLHVYDTRGDGAAVFWLHGTPNTGAPPEPLFGPAADLGIRWVSYDRPGYGGSTRRPGRDVASAAGDVGAIADTLGIDRFGVMGHSGGCPHALACDALLGHRVSGAVCVAALAPVDAEGLDWSAGMWPFGAAELHASMQGAAALERYFESNEWDPEQFTPADHAALEGEWSWLANVAQLGTASGPGGMIDDNIAYVGPWGFDLQQVRGPVLLLHGGQDRVAPSSHARWLVSRLRSAELWLSPDDGHISVLSSAVHALRWLKETFSRLPDGGTADTPRS